MVPDDHIINIIAKKLGGRATAGELQELQEWLKADPLHQKEYEELARIWQESIRLTAEQSFHTGTVKPPGKPAAESYADVQSAGRTPFRKGKLLLWTVAALIVVLAGLYIWKRLTIG